LPPVGATVGGRPILNLSLAINYAISGTSVWSYHAANLAIHVLASLVLYGIVRRTIGVGRAGGSVPTALSVALLWAVHPLLTESVTYTIQRAESLMGLFYLLTLYCFIRGAGPGAPGKRVWFPLCVCACLLGMATKEVMASAPLIVLLYDRTFLSGGFREAWRRRRWLYSCLASTWVVLALLIHSTGGRAATVGFSSGVSPWTYALTQLPAVAHYLRLCFWPHPLIFDYGTALARPSLSIVPGALVVIGLAGATAWGLVKRPAIGFLGAAFFVILAPSSSIIPIVTETVAEHRMYLPLIPVVVGVVLAINRWFRRAVLPLCLAMAAALLWGTWERNKTYQSAEAIWGDTIAKLPTNERAHYNLGCVVQDIPGRLNEALSDYEEAVRLKPDYYKARGNLGNALRSLGRTPEAIAQYEEALRIYPEFAEAHNNLAIALEDIPGRLGEAEEHLRSAVRIRPDYDAAYANLGHLLERSPGSLGEAVGDFETAIRLAPDSADYHRDLANALVLQAGRLPDAVAEYETALRLSPGSAETHACLANALARIPGRSADAMAQYEAALRIDPADAQSHYGLGYLLSASPGRIPDAISEFEAAVRLSPDFAEAHYCLGIDLAMIGNRRSEAMAHLEKALEIRPDFPLAQKALRRLQESGP
jgi:tetratricopeptide (TPR) repeat protein